MHGQVSGPKKLNVRYMLYMCAYYNGAWQQNHQLAVLIGAFEDVVTH